MVQKHQLAAFLKAVDASITKIQSRENDYCGSIGDPSTMDTVDIDWMEDREDEPVIKCSSQTGGAVVSTEAPASEWQIEQSVDDHQLFTRLYIPGGDSEATGEVYVWGPPAKPGAFEIQINEPDEEYHYFTIAEELADEDNPFEAI